MYIQLPSSSWSIIFYLLGPLNFATFQLSHPFPSVKQLKKLLGSESLLFPTQSKLRHCVQKPSVSSAGLFVPAFPDRHVGNFLPAANNCKAVPKQTQLNFTKRQNFISQDSFSCEFFLSYRTGKNNQSGIGSNCAEIADFLKQSGCLVRLILQ